MNDLSMLENRLRGWKPLRPSASLERRLFGRPERPSPSGWEAVSNLWTRASAPIAAVLMAAALVAGWSPTPGGYPEAALGGGLVQVNTAHLFPARPTPGALLAEAAPWRESGLKTFGWTNRSLVQTTSLSFHDLGGVVR